METSLHINLSKPQRGVLVGMTGGLFITIVVLVAAAIFIPPLKLVPATGYDKLRLLAVSVLLPVLTLAVSVARLASHRFWTPKDIGGNGLGGGTDQARLLQSLIQNTLEQVALAIPVYAAWILLSPPTLIGAVPGAALLFFIGRLLFFRGYSHGAPSRALGFSLTFYPTMLLLAGSLFLAIHQLTSILSRITV